VTRTYPHYSFWYDVDAKHWEIVRWDGPKVMEVVQTNIRTNEKANQALADWTARAAASQET
jgi:hypothetical protein